MLPHFGGYIMKKALRRTLRTICIILLALHDSLQEFWWANGDIITLRANNFVRDIKWAIPRVIHFIIGIMVGTPVMVAFMILVIKLS